MGVTEHEVRRVALSLPHSEERQHMGKPDFRVRGKIFASLPPGQGIVVLKLAPDHQTVLLEASPALATPAAGAWGRQGWTRIQLSELEETGLRGVLGSAWRTVAPASLIKALPPA
jgi:hypothetical protein